MRICCQAIVFVSKFKPEKIGFLKLLKVESLTTDEFFASLLIKRVGNGHWRFGSLG